ncbi:hypothetical protein IFM61606_03143 [Aspergillus udagawae]|nr:hypothetical protein IFM61606_03143 [Aspergillus udagawae]
MATDKWIAHHVIIHQTWNAAAATANPTATDNSTLKEPAPPDCCAPVADAVADEVVETKVEAAAPLVPAEALPVSRDPSQCQWSPCGSHPTDSVGLGTVRVAAPSSSSWSWSWL